MRRRPPAWHVLVAFGVERGALVQLEGGEGTSWRAGDLVLKPGLDERFVSWLARVGEQFRHDRVRLATPVAALDGRWVVGGWSARPWVDGGARSGDVDCLLSVSRDLHEALDAVDVAWPAFLRGRSDRWAAADRVAWGEERPPRFVTDDPAVSLGLTDLLAEPCSHLARQIVHGDLAGNVLFDDGGPGPPMVIELAPYHRPAGLADAIIVADAVARHGASPAVAATFAHREPAGRALLARAVMFRVLVAPDQLEAYRLVAEQATS